MSDEQALQKRITMAENRIQDLEWLLREKQLTEKYELFFSMLFGNGSLFRAAVVERDELKERTSQLERDFGQLKFENETLRYRLQDQTSSISLQPGQTIESLTVISPPVTVSSSPPPSATTTTTEQPTRYRSSSVSDSQTPIAENDRLTCSLSSFTGLL